MQGAQFSLAPGPVGPVFFAMIALGDFADSYP
jgi:hypothetical protein